MLYLSFLCNTHFNWVLQNQTFLTFSYATPIIEVISGHNVLSSFQIIEPELWLLEIIIGYPIDLAAQKIRQPSYDYY
jgi:hypothetical protein